jgi:hypothetical protein
MKYGIICMDNKLKISANSFFVPRLYKQFAKYFSLLVDEKLKATARYNFYFFIFIFYFCFHPVVMIFDYLTIITTNIPNIYQSDAGFI